MTDTLLRIEQLKVHFRLFRSKTVQAVDGVDIVIAQGEVVGLVGESGSGKTTLGKAIVGLHGKTAGQIYFQGEQLPDSYRVRDYRHLSQSLQMIFQDPYSSLNPRFTAWKLLREPLLLQGSTQGKARDKKTILDMLAQVGLREDCLSRYPHEFSGGQRQRLGIARALMASPELLICDEPLSALDVSVQAQVVNLMQALKAAMNLTLLFIAHDLSMVRYLSDRVYVMYLGIIVEEGDTDALFSDPLHPYTRMLIAANPVADPGYYQQAEPPAVTGEMATPVNVAAGCRFCSRCPEAFFPCHTVTPKLLTPEGRKSRRVACHLYTEDGT